MAYYPLGIAAFAVFYFVFYFAIKKWDLKTPGREDDDDLEKEKSIELASDDYTALQRLFLRAVAERIISQALTTVLQD